MKTTLRRVLPVLLLLVPFLVGTAFAPASAATPAPVRSEARQPLTPELIGIRFGRHETFDRVVADFRGNPPQAVEHQYVSRLVEDPSGRIVYIPGSVFLAVTIHGAAAHDESGRLTFSGPRQFGTLGQQNVQAVAVTGDFEATLSLGLGMQRASWVNSYVLVNPTRVVIDVGH